MIIPVLAGSSTAAPVNSDRESIDCDAIVLSKDLSIGDAPSDVVLGFITAACVDSAANIYVTDLRMQCIYKFDDDGRHIETYGTRGDGPGDLMFGAVMAMDKQSRMYMTGMGGRVQLMGTNWDYLLEFDREHPDNIARSIAVSPRGRIYIAAADILEQTAFDAYDSNFSYTGSFSETFGAGSELDWRMESLFAGGYLAVAPSEEVYYVQMTPFELRKFNERCELETTTSLGGGSFVPPPPNIEFSGNTVKPHLDGAASGIAVLDSGDVVVSAYKKDGDEETTSLILIYDKNLNLLAKTEMDGVFAIAGRDRSNRVFLSVTDSNGSRLVRASMSY